MQTFRWGNVLDNNTSRPRDSGVLYYRRERKIPFRWLFDALMEAMPESYESSLVDGIIEI
jgi:hypothetical protein